MRSIDAIFTQTVRAPLPEPPGTLATFSIRNIGYVVNQRPGQPVRLWAYDPATDSWIRKADFPGAGRSRGVAFSMARNGYFGLGLTPDGQGLRDIWQYNPSPTNGDTSANTPARATSFWPSSAHPTVSNPNGPTSAGATKPSAPARGSTASWAAPIFGN